MQAPFTAEEFLAVMTRYNEAVWPMQIVFYLLAGLLTYWALRPSESSNRWISLTFAFLWAWMGVAYHWLFFTHINPAAWIFGALFVAQAVGFLVVGLRGRLAFRFDRGVHGWTGAGFLVFALVAYPLLGALAGHGYPDGPTFGLPCPSTIVTLGLLLWATRPVPLWLLVIPALWSLIGTGAAVRFGIPEDYGLLLAGLLGTVLILLKNRSLAGGGQGRAVPA